MASSFQLTREIRLNLTHRRDAEYSNADREAGSGSFYNRTLVAEGR